MAVEYIDDGIDSRFTEIMNAMINGEEYTKPAQSRMEALLLDLKEVIDEGGGGGGAMSETTLWTNPAPSSDFAAQDITLSESIQNYDYIKVYLAFAKDALSSVWSEIMPVNDFLNTVEVSGKGRGTLGINEISTSYYSRYRHLYYKTDTTARFSNANTVQNSSAVQTNNCLIPLRVAGVKKGSGGSINIVKGTFPTTGSSKDLYPNISTYCTFENNSFCSPSNDDIVITQNCIMDCALQITTTGATTNRHYAEVKVNGTRTVYVTVPARNIVVPNISLTAGDVLSVHIYTDGTGWPISSTFMEMIFRGVTT